MKSYKTCSKCHERKPTDDFYKHRTKTRQAEALHSWCKPCKLEADSIRRGKGLEEHNIQSEMAQALGITPQAISETLKRAIRKLWQERDLRAICYAKQRGRLPESFRMRGSSHGGTGRVAKQVKAVLQ